MIAYNWTCIVFLLQFWTIFCLDAESDCGIRNFEGDNPSTDGALLPDITKRLAGAEEAVRGEFPWQVRLRSFGQLTYSGVLVRPAWVLTAASCFNDNYNPSLWTAVLNDLSSTSVDPGEQVIYVDSIFIYGGFKRGNSRNNFALVKLKAPVTDKKPACIANGTEDLISECVITGWGSTGPGEAYSTTLRKLKVNLLDADACSTLQMTASVGADQLCVTPADDTVRSGDLEGPCTGDRGSPVLCKTGDKWAVVGVVSDESACQSSRVTAPFVVNVGHFSTWINKVISQF
ncbi:hypothetical protein RRG08_040501 [Elysia crispata]|uniref:Peptidase S1 domain-containing protein n=1 Tax=Elysia crispata TaxID=231223 RepID=A0AAE0Z674_9GAST|nr:hypothetical protein RRG08_040501 [Elysia crispata]